jgi:hypothetical protein
VIRAWLGKANGRTGCVKHGIGRRWHAWKRCVCVDSFCSCPRGPSGLMGIERVGAIAGYIGRARWRGESSRFARRRWSATVIRGLYPYRRLYYAVCMCIVYVSSMTMSIWAVSDRGRASRLPRRVFFPSCCLCILRPWLTCLVASGTFFSHGLPVPSQAWCLPWSPPPGSAAMFGIAAAGVTRLSAPLQVHPVVSLFHFSPIHPGLISLGFI